MKEIVSYQTGKYILWALLCIPVLVMAIKGFVDLLSYNRKLKSMHKQKAEQIRLAEEKKKAEADRRRAFEAEYMNSRGGRF